MKRDMDLVRSILLAVEGGHTEFDAREGLPGVAATTEQLEYHLNLLRQATLLDVQAVSIGGSYYLQGLTWEGHDFLDTIRDPEVWKRTKNGASKLGGAAFSVIKDMAIAYGKHVAKERLGLDL